MEFNKLNLPRCKKFSGYKPCISYKNCLEHGCQLEIPETRTGKKILVISLDALGNVLLNTSILPSLKKKISGKHDILDHNEKCRRYPHQ